MLKSLTIRKVLYILNRYNKILELLSIKKELNEFLIDLKTMIKN